jgi:hypothetical protein
MHVVRGLLQAVVLVLALAAFSAVAAGLWTWASGDGGFRIKLAIALLAVAVVISLTGNGVLTRSGTAEINALQGRAPDHEEPLNGGVLTGVGVFLFVGVPLFLAGGLLYGTG